MSEIKRIAVHVDGGSRDRAVLRLALALAARHGAEAEAVFARIPPFIPASVDGILTPQIVEAQQAIYVQRAEAARKAVEDAGRGAAVKPSFTAADGPALDVMIARARFADLAVIGQPAPDESDAVADYDLPAELVMELGRPVLIVPNAGEFADAGRRVLVARAGTRESRRAASDALALLDAGSKLTVLMVNPKADNAANQADMKAWYARHGHDVEIRVVRTSEKEVGDVLRATAAEIGADLIVMGAYGRSRLRELILGGATHSILKHTAVPVLMSH
ncbi:MAG: universal stress protein [Alphaproteobacteria bacterium]